MKKEVVILTARCQKHKRLYGVRTEKRNDSWYFTWAFKLADDVAKREKFDTTSIDGGDTYTDDEYPGCPYCGNMNFIHCGSCNKICCAGGDDDYFTCPHCGNSGSVSNGGWNGIDIQGGSY